MTHLPPALSDFKGSWQIARRIEDRLSGQPGHFTGRARFDTDGTCLRYREEGLLTLGAAPPLAATREYIWRQEGGLIVIDHGDGSAFHRFDPADPRAEHHCAPDHYLVRYSFGRWPNWRAEWQVKGPRKDYRMISDYRRA